jgi:glycosyltransferase involved in cell wall biosynthesis
MFFVSSSLIEGFGIAHAEALACGLPVLTTKTAGPDEMIIEGLNGFFVEPSAQGIYQGLVRMSEARTLASREEISKTVDRFDSRKIAEKYGELFTGISSDNRIL